MKNNDINWYNTVLTSISDVASKFIRAFKKNGFFLSFGAMMVFVVVYTLVINPIRLDKIVERRFTTEKERIAEENELALQKRLQADEIVGQIMTRLTDKFPEIQRVLLLEGHNGTKTFGNTDLLFLTCTMEMLTNSSRNMEYVADNLQRQIKQNLIGGFSNTLKHREYIYYSDIQSCQHYDHRLFQKLKSVGDKECLLIPYKDNNNIIQLLLVITGENLQVDEITEYVGEFKQEIERCLM